MRPQFLFFSFSIILLFNSCEESSTGNTIGGQIGFKSEFSPYVLNGTVVDALNQPVAGADIHFLCTMKQITLSKIQSSEKATPTTIISFGIPEKGHASLRVYRLGTRELITTLVDTILQAGSFFYRFETSGLTNGLYVYRLISGKFFQEHLMLMLNTDLEVLLKTTPLVKTNFQGQFRLPQSVFGFDEVFTVTSEKGPDVIAKAMIDSIGIVINRSGKSPSVHWIKIDKNKNMEQLFTLN